MDMPYTRRRKDTDTMSEATVYKVVSKVGGYLKGSQAAHGQLFCIYAEKHTTHKIEGTGGLFACETHHQALALHRSLPDSMFLEVWEARATGVHPMPVDFYPPIFADLDQALAFWANPEAWDPERRVPLIEGTQLCDTIMLTKRIH